MDLLTIGYNGQNELNLSCGIIPKLSSSSHNVCINIIKGTHIYIIFKNHKVIFKEKVKNKAFLYLGYADPVTDTRWCLQSAILHTASLKSFELHAASHSFSSSHHTECHQRQHPRELRRLPARQRLLVLGTRSTRGGGGNPTLSTSKRS